MAGTYLDEDTMSADGLMHAVSHVNGLAVTAEGGDEGVWELCEVCNGLNLSAERFIIDDDSSMGAEKVRNSYLPQTNRSRPADFSLKSKSRKICLGPIEVIRKKSSTCPFCFLVIQSTRDVEGDVNQTETEPPGAICEMHWEVDGRESAYGLLDRAKGRTRRIHLSWRDSSLRDTYLMFVAPEKYFRPNSDALTVWGDEALFLGRDIDADGGKQALIRSWLDLCLNAHHGPCTKCVESDGEFGRMLAESYFGVIDVLDMRLTRLPDETEPYVALSYVWGRGASAPYTTNLQNIMLHRSHGGLEKFLDKLPRVIQSAIELVRRLGMRYIWIDSLCIVQNSSRSWNLNARVMDLIYGNAVLTICAADGKDSSAGLKAMEAKPGEIHQCKKTCAPGVTLMVSRPPETSIRASTWNTRAWTFQERLLSKRCLIFIDGRVYFQCRSTGMSEDIFADRQAAGWSLDLVHAPLQLLRELDRRAFWVYVNCVSLYTYRSLTKPKDILAAFRGICNLMGKTMQAPFIFGLPSSHFDQALLWEPESAIERRKPKNQKERDEYGGMEFPSWSWCGWTGGAMGHNADMAEGCLTDVHEWLMEHTWICWYIRDGHGNLRPLWDKEMSKSDQSTEERWRGYTAHVKQRNNRSTSASTSTSTPTSTSRERHVHNELEDRARSRHAPATDDSPRDRRGLQVQRRERREEPRNEIRVMQRSPARPRQVIMGEEWMGGNRPPRAGRPVPYRESYTAIAVGSESDSESQVDEHLRERRHDRRANRHDDRHGRRHYDAYGRLIAQAWVQEGGRNKFHLTLPENPYRVVMAPYTSESDKEFPNQPILQFWTWHTSLHVVPSDSPYANVEQGLRRYDIADELGDWCGSVILHEKWMVGRDNLKHEFIGISEAKNFTKEECETWTYYIPKERDQSEWDLFYVLLIERKQDIWERVGRGKVFRAAFANAKWTEIILG